MASRGGSRSRSRAPPGKKEKSFEQPCSTIAEEHESEPEPKPVPYVLQGEDIQALEIKVEDLEKLHAPRLPHDAGRIPIQKNYLVRKYRPKEVTHLVAHPVPHKAPRGPLTFSGPRQFDDGCEEILPHHILGSLQELRMEALARRNTQLADAIKVPHPDVTAAAVKEEHGEEKKEKAHWAQLAEHKAFQNWRHHMAMRKKQEKHLGEILHKPENELLMNVSDDYRQIQEERDLIDRSLPALFPGKGYRVGSEFWRLPEQIGDELTGLTLTLTRTECGHPEPLTHVGKPRTVQRETGLKPPKKIPCHLNWDKSLFLKHRRQELKSLLEELGFFKPDLEGLEVIGKGQPFTSVSAEAFRHTTISEEIETLSDPFGDSFVAVPEAEKVPSLVFCGQPARWIKGITACREIGIAARLTFEALASEKAESFLTVTNDGRAAIWYNWMRLPQQIPSRGTKGRKMPCFYFDTRPGVILPGETRRFSFIFKSERAGIFSESWEFRTHPLLLGGALLQVTLWGIAVYEDKLADFREKLESELAAREGAAIVKDSLNELLNQIRTPERTPSPVDACVTEEELFRRKNPELHYQHQVVKQLHKLWRQHLTVPSVLEEGVPMDQRSTAENMEYRESASEPPSAQGSTTELPRRKRTLEESSREKSIEEEEAGPSGWNLSLEDFKQAIMSIPGKEQREEALTQLNKAALELCVEQRPTQSDPLYPLCLQLWRGAIDDLVSHSLRLRSLLSLIKKDTYVEAVLEETEEVKQGEAKKRGKEDKIATKKEEKKDKEGKKSRGISGKENVDHSGSRKLKAEVEKQVPSISVQDVKGRAESVRGRDEKQKVKEEAATTDGVEPAQGQVDSPSLETSREKLYTEVSLTKLVSLSRFCSFLVRHTEAQGERQAFC
ncbi:radical S-adenosyl methionine domain-containing protein 1, mitochondrial isoform X1 [Hirundo rustica]|uniref:radical S-adenosyl methionine domain-containing protein 1, mitochondrial isoform X1 n=1 Tax=Hirundo rustica TaxID=43150 RepID=UPI001A94DC51|nr:radical S-adenosyl methionine domain-containing protein 1, mitochondrial isoform X1 [Hirundo rustica]